MSIWVVRVLGRMRGDAPVSCEAGEAAEVRLAAQLDGRAALISEDLAMEM